MLNYIWISLLAIGILTAVGRDIADEVTNPYRNGQSLTSKFEELRPTNADRTSWDGFIVVQGTDFTSFYGLTTASGDVRQPARVILTGADVRIILQPASDAPETWKTMAKLGTNRGQILGTARDAVISGGTVAGGRVEFESIRFVKLRAVTQAALDFANTAVEISIGLIGIMALWLGLIKVAEEAGLVLLLTRALHPITKRLFPEVPPDHPAVGSMIMNIAANMLGLNNAATPMGLKAMEELNKLNPKVGTATNAMCTFLVINTAGLTLIPATAMAVRAAAGSANPGIIIGTSIIGAGCATVAGLIAVKLLQRLPSFRVEEGKKP